MCISARNLLAFVTLLIGSVLEIAAQQAVADEPPAPFVPARPLTRTELDEREARRLYGLGLLRQQEDRLVEATRIFEEAARLDPEAAPLHKALSPLYLALGRQDEALAECRKSLDLDPGDFEVWTQFARLLKNRGQLKEARTALQRALSCDGIGNYGDIRAQLNYDLGVLLEELQEYEQAVSAFSEVVKILENPYSPLDDGTPDRSAIIQQAANTYERMIKLCIQARQYDRALRIFGEAQLKHHGLAKRLNYHLAEVYLAQAQPEKALHCLDEYLQTQPSGTQAYELRARLLKKLGRENENLTALVHFSEQDARNVPLRLLLAKEYARAGREAQAESIYHELAQHAPTHEVYQGLFTLYLQGHDLNRGVSLLDDTISKAAKNGNNAVGDPEAAAQARGMLGALRENPALGKAFVSAALRLIATGTKPVYQTAVFLAVLASRNHQLSEAEQLYRCCLDGPIPPTKEFAVYSGLIQVLRQARKTEALVEICQRGLSDTRANNRLVFHYHLSHAYLQLGKMEEAIAEANKAVESASDDQLVPMRINRMELLARGDRYEEAIAEGQKLLKESSQPGTVKEIRFGLSEVYSSKRDFVRAEEQLQLILKADPNDSRANNDLGYFWADQGKNLKEAERLIRKALDLDRQQKQSGTDLAGDDDQDNAAYLDSLGWVLFRRGQIEPAREYLEKAVTLARGEDDPTVWDHLGDVCFRQGDKIKARAAWQKSVGLYESDKRRKADEHYKELKHKLQSMESETQHP